MKGLLLAVLIAAPALAAGTWAHPIAYLEVNVPTAWEGQSVYCVSSLGYGWANASGRCFSAYVTRGGDVTWMACIMPHGVCTTGDVTLPTRPSAIPPTVVLQLDAE